MENLDTLAIATRLEGAGFAHPQASAVAVLLNEEIKMAFGKVATREHVDAQFSALRADIEKTARDQTRWIVTVVFGGIGLVLAIVSATVALLRLG